MSSKHWLGATVAAVVVGLLAFSAEAAPFAVGGNELKSAAIQQSDLQQAHWRRDGRWHRRHYYYRAYPRYYYGGYPYYYGSGARFYGPGVGFYIGPRGWW